MKIKIAHDIKSWAIFGLNVRFYGEKGTIFNDYRFHHRRKFAQDWRARIHSIV